MSEKRKRIYPRTQQRFKVNEMFPVQLEIPISRTSARHVFATFGMGGFGFFGTARQAQMLKQDKIPLHLVHGAKRIPLTASMRYCQFVPSGMRNTPYFIGFKYEDLAPELQSFLRQLIQAGLMKGHLEAQQI